MLPKVCVLVPRREDHGHRDRLWRHCRAEWEKFGYLIVEGHHCEGAFNRSAAINAAARKTRDADIFVIIDGDVLPPARVVEGVELALSTQKLVLPYSERQMVNPVGTRMVLDEDCTDPSGNCAPDRNRNFCSGVVIVPRVLFEAVGGFDERFTQWGGEDEAAFAACKWTAGVERLTGPLYHLHHEWSETREYHSGLYRLVQQLARRYTSVASAEEMTQLLAEPRTSDQIVLMCLTNGKRDTLAKTIDAADRMLSGPIGRKIIVGDNCSPVFDGWDTVRVKGGTYIKAVTAAIDVAIGSGQRWIFWLEDDFTIDRPVDLAELQAVMLSEPRLAQIGLQRQPWYEEELAAGGMIQARQRLGQRFTQREGWVQHSAWWTMNPMLTTREFFALHPWPKHPGSENRFYRGIVDKDPIPLFGIWGQIDDPPICTHIGVERASSLVRGY